MRELQIGDVFILEKGQTVMCAIPEKYVFIDKLLSNKEVRWSIVVGEAYGIKSSINKMRTMLVNSITNSFKSYGVKPDVEAIRNMVWNTKIDIDTSEFLIKDGKFVVVNTAYDGGSDGHDPYPNGHHVFCSRLNDNGTYNENAPIVDFYQSGCFTNMIEGIKPIDKMKKIVNFK